MKINDLPKAYKVVTLARAQESHCTTIIFFLDHKCIEKRNHDRLVKIYKQIRTIIKLRKLLVSLIDAFVFFIVLIGNCVATIIAYVINVVLLVSELWRPQQKKNKKKKNPKNTKKA